MPLRGDSGERGFDPHRRTRPRGRPGRGKARARLLSRRAPAVRISHGPPAPRLRGADLRRRSLRGAGKAAPRGIGARGEGGRPARGAFPRHEAEARHRLRPPALAERDLLRRAAHRPRPARHPAHEGLDHAARARWGVHRPELPPAASSRGDLHARPDPEEGGQGGRRDHRGSRRQPKYLVGTAVAIAYFYFVLQQRLAMPGAPAAASAPAIADTRMNGMAFVCVGLSALARIRVAFAWIAPAEKPALRFREAEIAFLFPAPITRRALIHFRLLSAQFAILFTSVLMAFFFNRFGYAGGNRALQAVGWWVVLSTFDLHLNGTKLTLARLREKASGFLLWRAAAVAAIALYVLAVA